MTASLQGLLADFDLPQIVSVLEVSRSTGVLEVQGPDEPGVLFIRGGEIVAAEVGRFSGEVAAFEVLCRDRGEFLFQKGEIDAPRVIDRSNQGLCLEAMRLIDECVSPELGFSLVGTAPDSLGTHERSLIELVKTPTSVSTVADSARIPRLIALYLLERLESVGVVARCELGTEAPAPLPAASEKIRLLLVDDSKLMRKVLKRIYESGSDIEVVGVAENGEEALELLPKLKPDVVSLDLYMPVMDGVTTLKRIMLTQPTPTIIVTSANAEELDLTFDSILRFGAIDFITKPSRNRSEMAAQVENILDRVRKAAKVNLRGLRIFQPPAREVTKIIPRRPADGVIATFAGTGGCLSYLQLLNGLPTDLPYCIVGHLRFPPDFLRAFVAYLDRSVPYKVMVAADGMVLTAGTCYLASDTMQITVDASPAGSRLRVEEQLEASNTSRLFMSVADGFGEKAIALLLSGSDSPAVAGLASVRANGGASMVQLPETCVDPGELRQVIDLNLADRVVLLPQISNEISNIVRHRLRRPATDSLRDGEPAWPRKSA